MLSQGFAKDDVVNGNKIVLVRDHINLSGVNSLGGKNLYEKCDKEYKGKRFPDMSRAYNEEMRKLVKSFAVCEYEYEYSCIAKFE